MPGVATTGKIGIGARLQLGDGTSPEVFATVANVVNMEIGGKSLNMVDATHVNSPDFYQEWLPGLKNPAPWTGTVQWDPTDATLDDTTGLDKKLEDRTLVTMRANFFQLGIVDAIEADGYVSELGNVSVAADQIMTRSFTFTATGKPRLVTVAA